MSVSRNLEEMLELLQHAKLDQAHLYDVLQSVEFVPHLSSEDYNIFEMPETLVADLLNGHDKIIELKDEPKASGLGRVYACTKEKTYSVAEAETSNTFLLASHWWIPSSGPLPPEKLILTPVEAVKNNYFEFQLCVAPSLKQLKQLLLPTTYYGPVEESNSEKEASQYFSRMELNYQLPCSQYELDLALDRLRAVELEGKIRLLDFEYTVQVIRDIFSLADENAWDWRKYGFSIGDCVEALSVQHSPEIIRQILTIFFARQDKLIGGHTSRSSVFPRNSRICQLIGEHLLSVTNSFDLIDFLALWKATVPDGLKPKLRRHLTCAGRAYCELSSNILESQSPVDIGISSRGRRYRAITLLRSEDLPDESVEARLQALFQRCSHWPEIELGSYLVDLTSSTSKKPTNPMSGTNPSESNSQISTDFDSDYEYEDMCQETAHEQESHTVNSDNPKPVSSMIATLLNRYCRVSNTAAGRIYTERHVTS